MRTWCLPRMPVPSSSCWSRRPQGVQRVGGCRIRDVDHTRPGCGGCASVPASERQPARRPRELSLGGGQIVGRPQERRVSDRYWRSGPPQRICRLDPGGGDNVEVVGTTTETKGRKCACARTACRRSNGVEARPRPWTSSSTVCPVRHPNCSQARSGSWTVRADPAPERDTPRAPETSPSSICSAQAVRRSICARRFDAQSFIGNPGLLSQADSISATRGNTASP